MPHVAYTARNFTADSLAVVAAAEEICVDYANRGYELTLRQLFYQFVSRGLLPNSDRNYKRLGSIVNDARLAGLIDWSHVVDRTRSYRHTDWHSGTPDEMVSSLAAGFAIAHWADQDNYVEVWIEKDALVGVIERPCEDLGVGYFSCRGYSSQTEMWGAAQRIGYQRRYGKNVTVLHLGDHDPSGIDMTRDITERLTNFMAVDLSLSTRSRSTFEVKRIALTMDQIEEYDPPPNPAKLTDSRSTDYIETYGTESWELDAMPPEAIDALVRAEVEPLRDMDRWDAVDEQVETERQILETVAERWSDVVDFLGS
jgi:hypothetical protein